MPNETMSRPTAQRRLRKLELQGFKSFPDKTVIEFREGITAVVGPNGSGKSNLADALLWVLGETSSKTLRGAKMEDVIFNGTKERKPMGYAEVSLYLDNEDRMFDVDYAEVVVTRRYYRSGESEYLLNKAPVRLRDIRELFRDTGLGRDGYSVIGQGMITDVIKSKPADRRFLFEEASGIAGLKFKKEESARKLDQAQENLLRINDIITELSDRLPSLEEKSRKARRYIDYTAEKKDLELFVWQKQSEKYTEDLGKIKAVKQTFDDQLQASEDFFVRSAEAEEAQNEKIRQLTVSMDEAREEKSTADAAAAAADAEILVLNNDVAHLQEEGERLRKLEEQNDAAGAILSEEKQKAEERIAAARERIRNLERSAEETAGKRSDVREKEDQINTAAGTTADETAQLTGQLTDLRIRAAAVEQSIADTEKKLSDLEEDARDAEEKKTSLKKALKQCENERDKFVSIIEDNKNRLAGYRMRFDNRKAQAEKKEAALQEQRIELSKKQSRLQLLSDMEKHFEGFNFAVRTVLQETQRGVLRGNTVTVASVITVEPKYAAAVEISLGSAIQNLITENEEQAKAAMLLLKNKNAGRATFLPLSTIRGTRLNAAGIETVPGFVGLGCDLIQYEPKYDPVMTFLLGRTAVCETIDDALALSRKYNRSFRIVTLDGQVINAGGSMTGGSLSKNTGILTRRNEIETLTEQIQKEEAELKQEEAEQKARKEDLARAEAAITEINAQSNAAEQNRIKAQAEYDAYAGYLRAAEEEEGVRQEQKEALSRLLQQRRNETEQIRLETENCTRQIAAREISTREAEERLAQLKAEQEQIAEKLHEIQLEILSETKNAEQNRATADDLAQRIAQTGQSKEETRRQQDETRNRIEEKRLLIAEQETQKEACVQAAQQAEDRLRKLAQERTGIEAEQNRMRAEEKEMYDARERLTREAERAQAKIDQLSDANDALLTRLWDEYEMTLSEVVQMHLDFDLPFARKRTDELKEKIRSLGHVDVSSIDEYAAVKERHETLSTQYADLDHAKGELEQMIASLEEEMAKIFAEQLKTINDAFRETFREMFRGGDAKLQLDQPDNILESGVEIYAAPPGKIIKNLVSLSGGEQALTAIALYFAILKIKPSPFCLLDEIEAALDDVNVTRYAAYLHRLAGNTQFVTITHRRGTMEEADKLYGVTMVEKGISRVLAVDVAEVGRMNEENGQ